MEVVDIRQFLIALNGENVDVVEHVGHHLALCPEILYEVILPLDFRRLFKSQFFGQRHHAGLHFSCHVGGVSAQDFAAGLDVFHVIIVALAANARASAIVDVIVQTHLIFPLHHAFHRHRRMAGPRMIERLAEVQQGVHRRHVAVRAVVSGPAFSALPCLENTGQILRGDSDGRVGFVVLQQHVVVGLISLDEVVFEQQRVFFRFHHDVADVANLRDEQARLIALLFLVEIRTDAPLQVLRLADIDDFPRFIEVLVATRCLRQVEHDSSQMLRQFLFGAVALLVSFLRHDMVLKSSIHPSAFLSMKSVEFILEKRQLDGSRLC